jgi:hypothetical protein
VIPGVGRIVVTCVPSRSTELAGVSVGGIPGQRFGWLRAGATFCLTGGEVS